MPPNLKKIDAKVPKKGSKSEPALELHSRAVPSVDAHHRVSGPNTGGNSGGRPIKKSGVAQLNQIFGFVA